MQVKFIYLFTIVSVVLSASFAEAQARSKESYAPKAGSVQRICLYRQSLLDAAEEFEVHPVHMFSCLLAEYRYLKDDMDNVVDAAAQFGFYKNPSLGMAQIRLSTGRVLAEEIHGRAISDQQVIRELLQPSKAARYMALLIRQIVDDYGAAGFDISRKPGLVCASYLVGNSARKAQQHKRNGTQPRLNYYGLFAQKNISTSQKIQSGELCR